MGGWRRGWRMGQAQDWTKPDLGLMSWVMFRGCQWLSFSAPPQAPQAPRAFHVGRPWAGLGPPGLAARPCRVRAGRRAGVRAGRSAAESLQQPRSHSCLDQPIPFRLSRPWRRGPLGALLAAPPPTPKSNAPARRVVPAILALSGLPCKCQSSNLTPPSPTRLSLHLSPRTAV